ncbi:hypothetical protein VNO78_22733 [Psophocarpus tetragonolobus]|uniref:Uncharacterized protein n=1 Tax=Psophocarpus tetragonolobus TaxID=3891 RepID=A0AAN9S239_PSOTE
MAHSHVKAIVPEAVRVVGNEDFDPLMNHVDMDNMAQIGESIGLGHVDVQPNYGPSRKKPEGVFSNQQKY